MSYKQKQNTKTSHPGQRETVLFGVVSGGMEGGSSPHLTNMHFRFSKYFPDFFDFLELFRFLINYVDIK